MYSQTRESLLQVLSPLPSSHTSDLCTILAEHRTFIQLYRFSKYYIMFHLHICEDYLHILLMLLATLEEIHMFPEYDSTMARDLYNIDMEPFICRAVQYHPPLSDSLNLYFVLSNNICILLYFLCTVLKLYCMLFTYRSQLKNSLCGQLLFFPCINTFFTKSLSNNAYNHDKFC